MDNPAVLKQIFFIRKLDDILLKFHIDTQNYWGNIIRNKSWTPECVGSFNMDWRILAFYPEPNARDKIY